MMDEYEQTKHQILVSGNVRVLKPWEIRMILSVIPKNDYRTIFKALLYSGMRYIEMQRLQENTKWFNGSCIHLSKEAMRKKKMKLKERDVHLSPVGREVISAFISINTKVPKYSAWTEDLVRWATKAGLDTRFLGPKTTRKTYESFLISYYPEKTLKIAQSQGHTTDTALEHYLNLNFSEQDIKDMKDFVEGWN